MMDNSNPPRRALDLSGLAQNEQFRSQMGNVNFEEDRFWRSLTSAITSNFPDVVYLDFSNNGLTTLEHLRNLNSMQNLTMLKLSNNRIQMINDVQYLKGLPLTTLDLSGNFIYQAQPTPEDLAKILSVFPTLETIDGFAIPENLKNRGSVLPPINPNSLVLNIAQEPVVKFIQQYFALFDTNKKELLKMYADDAVMSFSYNMNQFVDVPEQQESKAALESLKFNSRNLMFQFSRNSPNIAKILDSTILRGKVALGQFLSTFPKTQHNTTNYVTDALIFNNMKNEQRLMLTIHGQCTQTDSNTFTPYSRSLDCIFILRPSSDPELPLIIVNHQYHMRPYANLNLQIFVQQQQKQATSSPTTSSTQQPSGLSIEQQQLVVQFSQHTGLTHDWALKCLESVNWNTSNALQMFQTYHNAGQIPKEAYKL